MEYLPVEILAYIVSYSKQNFRMTCRTLNHYIPQYHFIYHNTAEDKLDIIDQQLAQRVSDRISVDFRDPPLKLRLHALKMIEMISKYANITSLNIMDLTSSFPYQDENTLLAKLTSLTNLVRLAIKRPATHQKLTHLSGLTKLTVSRSWRGDFTELKNLRELTLLECSFYSCDKMDGLTKLHIKTGPRHTKGSRISMPATLKQLTVIPSKRSDYVLLEPGPCRALESLNAVVYSIPSEISLNTNLTRLEVWCGESGCDLNTLSTLTQLQYIDLTVTRMTTPSSFSFLSKLPLRSAHLSIAKLDNTLSIQHFDVDKLHHLGLDIDANSKYKEHLTRLTALESLTLTATKLQSVTLTFLTRLTRLKLHQVQCTSVASFTGLKFLTVVGNQRALAGLHSLTNLEQLCCALKPTELNHISTLTRLRDLQLTVKGSVPFNVLAHLTQLTYLKVTPYNFPSITWLTSLTRLNDLDIISCAVKSEDFKLLTTLCNLTQLKVNCADPSTDVLFKLSKLQRIQLTPFQQPPHYKEQLMKNLPHFIALKINLQVPDDYYDF